MGAVEEAVSSAPARAPASSTWWRRAAFVPLGALSGAAAGIASYVFLTVLDEATELRVEQGWLVWLLPVGGFAIGLAYHRFAGRAAGGTALAVSEAHAYTKGAPARMAPMVLAGTVLGHLLGASVGREGTAIQMSSSITDGGARALRLDHDHRAQLARAALAGGFGSVFGVPFAGVVFAMEVARRRTIRALAAAVPAAFVGHWTVGWLGHHHTDHPTPMVPFHPSAVARLVVAACAFGLAARLFATSVPRVKRAVASVVTWPPLRLVIGGAATLALMGLVGREYLGLSLPLLHDALAGGQSDWWDPALKLLFTVVALGTGFVGGEVTPLFVIGGTLGSVIAAPLDLPPVALTALGFVAVFGAAAKVPLACAVMAVELFGWQVATAAVLVCVIARVVSGPEGIYDHPATSTADPAPVSGAAGS